MSKKEDWMNDDAADAASSMAFPASKPSKSCFRLTKRQGDPGVQVFAQTRGPTTGLFMRMPRQTLARLKKLSRGGHTIAIAAIVEQALDEFQAEGVQLIVEQA